MTRGERKSLLRLATRLRIRQERVDLALAYERMGCAPGITICRLEEATSLRMLQKTPSLYAFAESLNKRFDRPAWAAQRWGAK